MKTIAMFRRFGSEVSRLYELPEGANVMPGTIVTVDYAREAGSTATAYAVSYSYTVDETQEKMIADLLHIRNLGDLKRVRSIYTETPVDYADEVAEEADETEEEG